MSSKNIIWMVIMLAISQAVLADRIMILNLHYSNGEISVIDQAEQYGYYPDRKLQPDSGYRAEIISTEDNILYSFNFEVPLRHFTDVEIENKTQGGLVLMDETDFALIIPLYDNAKEINFYNDKGENILVVNTAKKTGPGKAIIIIVSVFIALAVYIILKFSIKKSKT